MRSVGVDEPATIATAQPKKGGGVAPPETQKDRKPAAEEAKVAAETESTAPSRPAASPAGKMSLGRNNASDQPAAVPAPANGEAWDAYMQHRFSGGMNYEGLGARFSKEP
jgi:hypothetical protein